MGRKIKFETAKLAKALFDVSSEQQKGYDEDGNLTDNGYSMYIYNEDFDVTGLIAAPYQDLLKTWLRDAHRIHIEVNYHPNTSKWSYGYLELDMFKNASGFLKYVSDTEQHPSSREQFDVYEDALEAGLVKGLTLLKTKTDAK